MNSELIILLLVIVTALAFDFTNGFHDTGNAMATSIATGAYRPRTAVTVAALLNVLGALLSVEVAKARAVLSTVCRVKDTVVIEGEATVMITSRAQRAASELQAMPSVA